MTGNALDDGSCVLSAGKLHFVKFETSKMDCVFDFIVSKGLHHLPLTGSDKAMRRVSVKATGGGSYKFADEFQVSGASFDP